MKKIILIFMAITFAIGNVNSQTKRTLAKRTTNSVAAKKKAEAKAKAEAEAKAQAQAEAEAKAAYERDILNSNCKFNFSSGVFVSGQNNDDYVVYEIPEMTASELKSAVYTTLTSMFKSPKDAITNLNDNMIQLEGYSPCVYKEALNYNNHTISNHIIFSIVIQFKDGKVRYNAPSLKYIHMKVDNSSNTQTTANVKGVNMKKYLGDGSEDKLKQIEDYFNNLIYSINSKLKKSNDW